MLAREIDLIHYSERASIYSQKTHYIFGSYRGDRLWKNTKTSRRLRQPRWLRLSHMLELVTRCFIKRYRNRNRHCISVAETLSITFCVHQRVKICKDVLSPRKYCLFTHNPTSLLFYRTCVQVCFSILFATHEKLSNCSMRTCSINVEARFVEFGKYCWFVCIASSESTLKSAMFIF